MVVSAHPQTLRVLILPQEMRHAPIENVLYPLKMLRGVQNVIIRDATPLEWPDIRRTGIEFRPLSADDSKLVTELTYLISSNEQIELAFVMFPALLRYAQAFEKHHIFKGGRNKPPSIKDPENHHEDRLWSKVMASDPVEIQMRVADEASLEENLGNFKEARRFVIEYLEPQYQCMLSACERLSRVLSHGLDYDRDYIRDEEEAYGHLEQCAVAFKRDIPQKLQAQIQVMKRKYGPVGNGPLEKRSRILRNLWATLRDGCTYDSYDEREPVEDFQCIFPLAVKDLGEDYCEVRRARKGLFEFDFSNDTKCNIKVPHNVPKKGYFSHHGLGPDPRRGF